MFKLPHISTYKNRSVRRCMILLTLPIEIVLVTFWGIYDVLRGAYCWWKA